jgi:hypothetical protein
MKYFIICTLIVAGVIFAGCTGTQAPPPVVTPAPTAVPVTTTLPPATTSPPSFTMGDHYLRKSYTFQSESDVQYEEFRVDNPSWGIGFDILPLNDNLQYCWFELTVTNMDTGHADTFGYGRDNSFELHQKYPMYTTGPYKITLKGNHVKADVTAAKRNP